MKNLLQISSEEYYSMYPDTVPLTEPVLLNGIKYTHTSIIHDMDGNKCELLTSFTISVPSGEVVGANIAYDRNDVGFMKLAMSGIYPLWSAPKHVWDTMTEYLGLDSVVEEEPTMHGDEYLLLTGEI